MRLALLILSLNFSGAVSLRLAAIAQSDVSSEKLASGAPAFETNVGGCACDMHQLECWPTEDCFQTFMDESQQRIAEGHEMRMSLKATVKKDKDPVLGSLHTPLGKTLQYATITNFQDWLNGRPIGSFTNSTEWLRHLGKDEDVENLELEALQTHGDKVAGNHNASDLRQKILKGESTPDETLLAFAHMLRMMFNRQPNMQDAYKSHVATIHEGKGELPVAMHVRRADSCEHAHTGYETSASAADSAPQMSGVRHCYDTSVYVDKLAEVYDRFKLPMVVYLATDDTASVVSEIKNASRMSLIDTASDQFSALAKYKSLLADLKSRRNDIYEKTEFRYLDYPRDSFNYDDMIEVIDDNQRKFFMESGIGDLWHLSHGQFFIGSLGSRFSKAAYLLAVARHNNAIPYASVDGHNLCCEIDEQCARANTAMKSMTDCLTYAHELNVRMGPEYWTEGSMRPGLS